MKKLTNEEKILQVLLNKYENGKNNSVTISLKDIEPLDMIEKDAIRSLHLLQTDDLIRIPIKANCDSLRAAWIIELKSAAIHYFEKKKQKSTVSRREWVRTYLPVTISLIALVKSFSNEIISLVQLIMQLLK